MDKGLIAFFVILGVVLLLLCVLGGCYSANKGKMGFLTKFLNASATQDMGSKQAMPRLRKAKKMTALSHQAKMSAPPSRNLRTTRKMTAAVPGASAPVSRRKNRRGRRRVALTGTGTQGSSAATAIRGGTSLSATQILDVEAQSTGVHSFGTQRTAFAAGAYLPYNIQIPNSSALQKVAYTSLSTGSGDAPPGYHNDPLLDAAATLGASAYPHYNTSS
jgi:hypothetical protein